MTYSYKENPVWFETHLRNKPQIHIKRISAKELSELIERFQSTSLPYEGLCVSRQIQLKLFKPINPGSKHGIQSLGLVNFQYSQQFFCVKEPNPYNTGTEVCVSNFITGKCKCPFMRKTLGNILFPRHYKEK